MTCPTETTSLISWPLVSASASSFRNDCAGSLSYASKCLTNRYQHLIVNCCIFSINLEQYKNAPSFNISYETEECRYLNRSNWLTDRFSHIRSFNTSTSRPQTVTFTLIIHYFANLTIWRCSIKRYIDKWRHNIGKWEVATMLLTKSAGIVISDAPVRNLEGLGRLQ